MRLALEFRAVRKKYGGRVALDGLDLQVPQGSIFGLVGSNGAGKTTAMALTVGLLRPHEGSVHVLGNGSFNPQLHAGKVTLLPQDSRLPPHGHVEELLRYYAALQGLTPAEQRENVDAMLRWTHLVDRADSQVRTLSHGMARRLAIAQAFLGQPELVLLDEPLSGLDPREAARIRSMIAERRGRQTIVISSHILTDIELLCDHVAFIEQGRLVRQTTVANATGRASLAVYTLRNGQLPLERIKSALPGCEIEWDPAMRVLSVRSMTHEHALPQINQKVCAALFDAGVELLEIRCGSTLEQAYFEVTASQMPMLPPPPRAGVDRI